MNRMILGVVMAVVTVGRLTAITVGPEWCVAYPENGSPDVNRALRVAAEEVRNDINEATGLKLSSLPASKAKAPAIYIGAEFAKKAGLCLSDLEWYDNVIAEKDGSIYLFGNDRPGRDRGKLGRVDWQRCMLPSIKAATRFLETAVGVRFLMPGAVGKEVSKRKDISVKNGLFSVERPMIKFSHNIPNDMIFCIANGLWGMGVFHSYGGHSYPSACPSRYFASHPEYFAMKNGKRILGSTSQCSALCISNPEVEELIVDELKRRFDSGAEVCQLAQQDGLGVCECENCKAMYGTGDDWCEKFWLFHRHIAERMLKERPGKIVHILSYAKTFLPPKTFKVFPSNVMIEMCRYSDEAFKAWEGYTIPQGITVYTYLSGTYVFPGFVARHSFAYLAELVKRFRDNNVRGICRTGGWDLWGTEGPGYYVYNRLLLDKALNVKDLLSDYCSSAFGPAAAQMLKFYEVQDVRLRMFDRVSEGFFPSDSAAGISDYVNPRPKNPLDYHGWMFSPETTLQMEECLSRAEKTEGLSLKQRKRLELVRLEFDYAKNLGAISTLYSAYKLWPSKEMLLPLAAEIENRTVILDRIFGGKKRPLKLKGWPEVSPFGYGCTREIMNMNGRLGAKIGAPLNWSAKMLKNALPGVNVKRATAESTKSVPSFADFADRGGWNGMESLSMEEPAVSARFKAVYDDSAIYLLVESNLSDDVSVKSFPYDGGVWCDDCIDMTIAPGDTKDVRYHFIYGPDSSSRYDSATGLIKDHLDPNYGKADVLWNGRGWKTESSREGGRWRSIATIPYSDLGISAPKAGDVWFINVGRIAKTGIDRKNETLLLWSTNMELNSMSDPEAMGMLDFK